MRVYNTDDLYVGDIIQVEEIVYKCMNKNNNKPWVEGKVLPHKKHNIFVKVENGYIHVVNEEKYPVLTFPCKEGDRGIQENSIIPLKKKFALSFKENKIKSLNLNMNEIMEFENIMSNVSSEDESDLADAFEKFLDFYNETEKDI